MAITYLAWRGCPLQEQYGEIGFHELWIITLDRLADSKDDTSWEGGPDTGHLNLHFHLKTGETIMQKELNARLQHFQAGIPECDSCPVNFRNEKIGCCATLHSPLDEKIETFFGEYFASELKKKDSVAYKFYETVIFHLDHDNNPFNLSRGRGYAVDLTTLKHPVEIKFGSFFKRQVIDSGMIANAIYRTVNRGASMSTYRGFLTHIGGAVRSKFGSATAGSKSCKELAEYTRHFGLASRSAQFQKWIVDVMGE